MSFYTSYETSLRLKEAGAPQKIGDKWAESYWWVDPEDPDPPQMCQYPHKTSARAFRSDEIIEALGPCLQAIYVSVIGEFQVDWEAMDIHLEPIVNGSAEGTVLVEALAEAYLAVLLCSR